MISRRTTILTLFVTAATSPAFAKVGFRQLTSTHPAAVQRGTTAEVKLKSNFTLNDTYQVFFGRDGIKMTFIETEPIEAPRKGRGSKGTPFRFQVDVPADQLPGVYEYRVATNQAVSSCAQLLVTDYPVVEEEQKENGTVELAQTVDLPAAICGVCEKFEDVDCFTFDGTAGQELTLEIFAQRATDKIHSMVVRGPRIYLMDPILTLIGPNGQVIAQNDNYFGGDSFIYAKLPGDGQYTLEVRDARYAGDPRYTYCVEISDQPYAHALFPLAVQQGQTASLEIVGHMMNVMQTEIVAADLPTGWSHRRIETPRGSTNPVPLKISPHPQFVESEGNNSVAAANSVSLPVGINGRLAEADDVDFYKLEAKKGQQLLFEVEARRQHSPIDSVLELYDSDGKLLAEADDIAKPASKDSRLLWTAPSDGDLRRPPAARTPDGLELGPPFPPAAERCAFTCVASSINAAGGPPASASCVNMSSHTPLRAQRTKRL